MNGSTLDRFSLADRVVVITGGAGLLGRQHAAAVLEAGGAAVLLDIDGEQVTRRAEDLARTTGGVALGLPTDITSAEQVDEALAAILARFGRVDALVNNAAINPAVGSTSPEWARLEHFPVPTWNADLAVGLTGAFLCSRAIGAELARRGRGSIVNIASDLALIGPDQRIYRDPALPPDEQPVKPVSYPVVKAGLIGLTRYLATYWAEQGVRVNALSPGGVRTNQDSEFVDRLTGLIPLGRMAEADEYRGALVFLLSDASSYMTGANLVVDGGRTAW